MAKRKTPSRRGPEPPQKRTKNHPPRDTGRVIQNVFVPLAGKEKQLWLKGQFSQVLANVKGKKPGGGRVQSLRLVFPRGRVQKNVIGISTTIWDEYLKFAFPKQGRQWVTGFQMRVAAPMPRGRQMVPASQPSPFRSSGPQRSTRKAAPAVLGLKVLATSRGVQYRAGNGRFVSKRTASLVRNIKGQFAKKGKKAGR